VKRFLRCLSLRSRIDGAPRLHGGRHLRGQPGLQQDHQSTPMERSKEELPSMINTRRNGGAVQGGKGMKFPRSVSIVPCKWFCCCRRPVCAT